MIRSLVLLAALLLAACASAPSPATTSLSPSSPAPAGPAPGHWQLVIEVDGLPGAGRISPQTMTLCSTPEDKKQWQDMVGGKSAAGCVVKDYRSEGATISYAMQCAGGIEGSTRITILDDNRYRGESSISLKAGDKPAVLHSKVTANRLSPVCKK